MSRSDPNVPNQTASNPNAAVPDWPALTGVRGLAALAVLGMHAHVLVTPLPWLKLGHFGVDVFFVLSGFLLTLVYGNRHRNPARADGAGSWRYLRQRLGRILPAYYAQILLLGALAAIDVYSWPGWRSYLGQFSLAFYLGPEPLQAWVAPWWSLPVELSFYLLFPLALAGLKRQPLLTVMVCLLIVYGYRYGMMQAHAGQPWLAFWLQQAPGRFDEFLLGMLAAWLVTAPGQAARLSGKWLFWLGLAGFASMLSIPDLSQAVVHPGLGVYFYSLLALAIACMLAGLYLGAGLVNRLLSLPPLLWLGQISFGIYLWHYAIIDWLRLSAFAGAPGSLRLCLVVALSLLCGALSWVLIERPMLRWLKQRAA